ncbi:MAG: hypothetical protein ACXWQO_11915 [Bdellovibrionota bacterium]
MMFEFRSIAHLPSGEALRKAKWNGTVAVIVTSPALSAPANKGVKT